MRTFRKSLLAGLAGVALTASVAAAANLSLLSGASNADPSQFQNLFNQFILSLNAGVTGNVSTLPASAVTSGTSAYTLMTYTMPGGTFATVGNGLRVHAWGVNSADANVKTVTLNFGASSCSVIVTGSSNQWTFDAVIYKTGSSTQASECHGVTATTPVVSAAATWSITDTAAITVTIQGTAATSGTITLQGAVIEQIK
jgi:hypothetical protein